MTVWDWSVFFSNLVHPAIIRGLWTTVWLTFVTLVLAILVGAALALVGRSRHRVAQWFYQGYVAFFRATPLLVQLVFLYSALLYSALPLPMIVRGKGPVICFPPIETLVSLLSGMGDVVLPESEAELRAMGGVSGFMSSFFELEQSLADGLTGQGVPARNANLYVRSMIAGLAETGNGTAFEDLPGLAAEHETKGGLNERTRRYLKESGWFGAPDLAFAAIREIDRKNLQ